MSFDAILEQIVAAGPGVLGVALVGNDGLVVAQAESSSAQDGDGENWDISTLGVEFGRIIEDLNRASSDMGVGGIAEVMVRLDRVTLIASRVDEDLLLILGLAPDGNIGKARYLMRRDGWAIRQEI